jgi:hypothetical protein
MTNFDECSRVVDGRLIYALEHCWVNAHDLNTPAVATEIFKCEICGRESTALEIENHILKNGLSIKQGANPNEIEVNYSVPRKVDYIRLRFEVPPERGQDRGGPIVGGEGVSLQEF